MREYLEGISEKIRAFRARPLLSFEGDVSLLGFDPMNLECADGLCLHARGMLRIHGLDMTVDGPFLAEFDGSILNVRKIWMPGKADEGCGRIVIEGVGAFQGRVRRSQLGLVVSLDEISS